MVSGAQWVVCECGGGQVPKSPCPHTPFSLPTSDLLSLFPYTTSSSPPTQLLLLPLTVLSVSVTVLSLSDLVWPLMGVPAVKGGAGGWWPEVGAVLVV